MYHVVGVDPQRTRTAVVLREGDGRAGGAGGALPMVGDGYRRLIPNASLPPQRWATIAAEALLDAVGEVPVAELAALARSWCCDPLDPGFLTGLRARLFGYLGRLDPVARNGYRLAAVAVPGRENLLRERFTEAGLADLVTVDPADALLARWLVDPARPAVNGSVIAVSCGETWARVAAYTVDADDPRTLRRLAGSSSIVDGELDLTGTVLSAVLARCRQGVRSAEVLPIFDGALELANQLRTLGPADEVDWSGPLADRMFEPLRLSRAALAASTGVGHAVGAIADRVRTAVAMSGTAGPAALLVGGIGAVWPAVADGLTSLGPVWRSPEPESDLAIGAAWWPSLRYGVQRDPEIGALPSPGPVAGHEPAPPRPPTADVPPWLR